MRYLNKYLFFLITLLLSSCKKDVELFVLFDPTIGNENKTRMYYSNYLENIKHEILKTPPGCRINFFLTTCELDNTKPFCIYTHDLIDIEEYGQSGDSSIYRLDALWDTTIVPVLLLEWEKCHNTFQKRNSCILNTLNDVGDFSDTNQNINLLLIFSDLIETSNYVHFDSNDVNINDKLINLNLNKVRNFDFIGFCYGKDNPTYDYYLNKGIKIDELWKSWLSSTNEEVVYCSTNEKIVLQNLLTKYKELTSNWTRFKEWLKKTFRR